MASSGGLMPLKKQLLPHNFDAKNRYSCLNLNQIRQCSNVSIVHSKSKSISKNKGFGKHKCCCSLTIRHNIFGLQQHQKIDSKIVADENSRSLWNKSSSITLHSNPFKSFTEFDEAEATVKTKRWKNYSVNATSTTSSTLSLHIAAYENFVEGGDTVTLDKNKCSKKDVINGQKQTLVDSALNPIEFPRQQTADETDPAVMQFTASQQLLNPNQLGSSLDNQRRPPSSAQNRGSVTTYDDKVFKKLHCPRGISREDWERFIFGLRLLNEEFEVKTGPVPGPLEAPRNAKIDQLCSTYGITKAFFASEYYCRQAKKAIVYLSKLDNDVQESFNSSVSQFTIADESVAGGVSPSQSMMNIFGLDDSSINNTATDLEASMNEFTLADGEQQESRLDNCMFAQIAAEMRLNVCLKFEEKICLYSKSNVEMNVRLQKVDGGAAVTAFRNDLILFEDIWIIDVQTFGWSVRGILSKYFGHPSSIS